MKWLVSLLEWINLLLVLTTFLCYLAPYISPATFWPASFVGLGYPLLLVAHLFFVLLWAIAKKKFIVLSLLSLGFGWSHIQSLVGFNFTSNKTDNSTLTIASFNARGFQNEASNKLLEAEELSTAIDLSKVDILCLQELPSINKAHYVYRFLSQEMGLIHHIPLPIKGMSIFSRYPLKNTSTQYFENGANGYQTAEVEIDSVVLRIINVHLQSNAISGLANVVAEEGNLQEKETWLNIRGMMTQYKHAAIKRARQAETISSLQAESPYPVILCGDFNDIPQSYVYHTLVSGLQDGFKLKGRGLGITYAGKIPGLRIDYILASEGLIFSDYTIGKTNFSDHYPVFSSIRLKGE